MKRIRIYEGAAIQYDTEDEKKGITVEANTKMVDDVKATAQNIKKYIQDKKYPEHKPKR